MREEGIECAIFGEFNSQSLHMLDTLNTTAKPIMNLFNSP